MAANAIKVRRVLFAASCFTSALFLTAIGSMELRKVLSK